MNWKERPVRIADGTSINWFCEGMPLLGREGCSHGAAIANAREVSRRICSASSGYDSDEVLGENWRTPYQPVAGSAPFFSHAAPFCYAPEGTGHVAFQRGNSFGKSRPAALSVLLIK